MKQGYKVTYRRVSEECRKTHEVPFIHFENAVNQYNELIKDFDEYADVKLVVEVVLMSRA